MLHISLMNVLNVIESLFHLEPGSGCKGKNMKPLTYKVFFFTSKYIYKQPKNLSNYTSTFPMNLTTFLAYFSFFLLVLSDDIKIQGGFKKEQKTQKSYYAKSLEQQTYKVIVTI